MRLDSENFTIALSPQKKLYLLSTHAGSQAIERIRIAFSTGFEAGLMQLGLSEVGTEFPPDLAFWRDFARLYFSKLCALPNLVEVKNLETVSIELTKSDRAKFIDFAPPMLGGEYLNEEFLVYFWDALHAAVREKVNASGNIHDFFSSHGSSWNLVGRVCFHLAENKADEQAPFAFLATYSHALSTKGKVQYLPLGRALQEYAGLQNKGQLLKLLLPVQKAAKESKFLQTLVKSGEIFHPLAWPPAEAFHFLQDIPFYESSGILVRVPDWWKSKKPPRPMVSVTVGGKTASTLGVNSMLEFSVELTLEGERLTKKELEQILSSSSGLALIRGKWVEIDQHKLNEVLDHWKSIERAASTCSRFT